MSTDRIWSIVSGLLLLWLLMTARMPDAPTCEQGHTSSGKRDRELSTLHVSALSGRLRAVQYPLPSLL